VSISHVTEIVNAGDLAPVPNAPSHIRGVMDLRGSTTTIVDPKTVLNLDSDGEANRIIVFDTDLFDEDRSIGWVVDGVREVTQIDTEELDEPPTDEAYISGIVKRDGRFIVWLDPRAIDA
jgi:purine-binding chemotaxis protein CheW